MSEVRAEEPDVDVMEGAGRRLVLKVLSLISFLVVLVGTVSVVVITSFDTLITHEEDIRVAWERVQAVQDERRDLLADILHRLGSGTLPVAVGQEWRRAQSAVDEAAGLDGEVRAQPAADGSFSRLVSEIRDAVASDDSDNSIEILNLLDRLGDAARRLGVERRLYNEEVQNYRRYLERIPTRWVAHAFGFEDTPEYGNKN